MSHIDLARVSASIQPPICLGPNHGYLIEGDVAQLHADIAVADAGALTSQAGLWALQLWACEAPYQGGPVSGIKVAEALLPLSAASQQAPRLDAATSASLPAGQRDYSMVMVLASGAAGSFDQVQDFANYPARERFITPHLQDGVGYRIEQHEVVLRVDGLFNPRRADNMSGSLSLELWAEHEPYRGGPLHGTRLAAVELGCIAGQRGLGVSEWRSAFQAPAPGAWNMTLVLREWAGAAGYVTRDFCDFAVPYVNGEVSVPAVSEPQPQPLAAKVAEPVRQVPVVAKAPEVQRATPTASVAAEIVRRETPSAKTPEAAPKAPAAVAAAEVVQPVAPSAKVSEALPQVTPALDSAVVVPTSHAKVSIMHASIDELAAVHGLSRKLASAIVKARPFTSVDELVGVRGIGPKLLVKLRALLVL